ncbi:MAG: tyrosine-protein phosphatase [Gammaproteobacteria bacterium]|nr:tyrosine-protein phosphatase [Gammaproteobacteria bacterium]
MKKPNHFYRITMLILCVSIVACATPTRPPAVALKKFSEPAPIINFQVVSTDGVDGVHAVYRSGQPKGDADWAYLQKIGVKTVVKLNEYASEVDASEELRAAKLHNINVIPIYMPPEDFPKNLNLWAHPEEKAIMKAVEALENNENLPVLVHCSHGKDRTGLVVAVYSVRNKNYCKDAAINEMKYYGTNNLLFGLKPMLDSPSVVQSAGCTHEFTDQQR